MTNIKITIRKDSGKPSRPWCADMEMDGKKFTSWMWHWRSKSAMMREINGVLGRREWTLIDDRAAR